MKTLTRFASLFMVSAALFTALPAAAAPKKAGKQMKRAKHLH